jgi:hypothetical protein
MLDSNHRTLDRVAEMVDQLIDQTIALLVLRTHNPDQLVLNVTREQALRGLQQILDDEMASAQVSGERAWQFVSAILATAVACIVDTMSDSTPYKHCREQSGSCSTICDTRLLTAGSNLGS